MKVRDWYDLLLKENMTHKKINGEYALKISRMESIYPMINHSNSFQNIRKIGLPSKKMSLLWKLKYDLFLTEEKKKYFKISSQNRCQKCQKVDSTGHFLLCTKSETFKMYEGFIEYCKKVDPFLSAIKLIHMDLCGNIDEIFAIGWVLATLTETHYSKKSSKNLSEVNRIKIALTIDVTTFKFLDGKKYTKILELINLLLQF